MVNPEIFCWQCMEKHWHMQLTVVYGRMNNSWGPLFNGLPSICPVRISVFSETFCFHACIHLLINKNSAHLSRIVQNQLFNISFMEQFYIVIIWQRTLNLFELLVVVKFFRGHSDVTRKVAIYVQRVSCYTLWRAGINGIIDWCCLYNRNTVVNHRGQKQESIFVWVNGESAIHCFKEIKCHLLHVSIFKSYIFPL